MQIDLMFAAYCEAHRGRVLLSPSNIEAVRAHAGGIDVDFRCHCGAAGVWHTGVGHRALAMWPVPPVETVPTTSEVPT